MSTLRTLPLATLAALALSTSAAAEGKGGQQSTVEPRSETRAPTPPPVAERDELRVPRLGRAWVGPTLNPLLGTQVRASDRELLPNARHLANLADLWFVEIVNIQNSGAGVATFDPVRISSHGRSWTRMGHYWNNFDVTDPANPGQPLLDLPYFAWDSIHHQSLFTDRPGLHVAISPRPRKNAFARLSGGGAVGGPLLIPGGFMDREPSFGKGASPTIRGLRRDFSAESEAGYEFRSGSIRTLFEYVDHRRRYPTLVDSSTGAFVDDTSDRATAIATGSFQLGDWTTTMLLATQWSSRSHEDAQFRLPLKYTRQRDTFAGLFQLSAEKKLDDVWNLRAGIGYGGRDDDKSSRSDRPIVSDIEEEWLWLGRPSFSEDSKRHSFDSYLTLERAHLAFPVELSFRASHAKVRESTVIPGGLTGETYNRGAVNPNDPTGVALTHYEPSPEAQQWLQNARIQADGEWLAGESWSVRYGLGLDYAAVGTPGTRNLDFLTPGAGLAAIWNFGEAAFYAGVRREPEALTREHAAFLDPGVANGSRFRWNDDGDGIPEVGEEGALLNRTGGRYHTASNNLARPTSNQFVFGWESPFFGPFQAVLTGIMKWQLDPMTVRLAGPAAGSYEQRLIDDPGGDGRGEESSAGGVGAVPIYDRIPGTEGEEIYELTNRSRDNRYIGTEIQLMSIVERDWFLNLQAKGYWNIGSATYGSFPDRNDPGILDENSATPNQRVNQRGRFDQDRSFAINLLMGREFFENFTASMNLRYRDGQPFTRILVADTTQGPTPIMAVWRGAPRHTFHMTVDARLRYDLPISRDARTTFIIDGFNILGSATELNEDPRNGAPFRRAYEVMPARAVLGTIEFSY